MKKIDQEVTFTISENIIDFRKSLEYIRERFQCAITFEEYNEFYPLEDPGLSVKIKSTLFSIEEKTEFDKCINKILTVNYKQP